jgi:hypothetical protein
MRRAKQKHPRTETHTEKKKDTIWLGSICTEIITITNHAHVFKVARMMSECRMKHIFCEG